MGTGVYYSNLSEKGLGDGFGICSSTGDSEGDSEGEGDFDQYTDILDNLRTAFADIGGDIRPHSTARVPFNKCMRVVGEAGMVTVGLQGWEHDYVIEVGGSTQVNEFLEDTEWHERDIVDAYGVSPERFKANMADYFEKLNRYLCLWMMEETGYDCYKLSGGWGMSMITFPADALVQAEMKRLKGWLQRRNNDRGLIFRNAA